MTEPRPSEPPASEFALRVVALADTDSYVKWAAALLGSLPRGSDAELLVIDTPLAVSDAQLRSALARSGLDSSRVRRVRHEELPRVLADLAPDAVVTAARGPVVRVLIRTAAALTPRPVIVSGLPGISIPATAAAVIHRIQSDLFVLHSIREIDEFTALTERRGLTQRFGLSRLPFAASTPPGEVVRSDRRDLVFASQAIVPRELDDRMRVARLLVDAARADPSRRVVVKERAQAGEHQTHAQRHGYRDLLQRLAPLPQNLVISTDTMAHALDSAEGLVTVSSTAAIEAVARGIPVIALDSFGVDDRLINPVFVGSGLFGSEEAVLRRDFRFPSGDWLRRNYFHDPAEDDWVAQLGILVSLRRSGQLAPKAARARRGGTPRDVWERKLAYGRKDRSLAGAVIWVVGVPARFVLRILRRLFFRPRLKLPARERAAV